MEEVKRIVEVDLEWFVRAVEDNNIYNDGSWKNWKNGLEVIEVYTNSEGIEYIYDEDKDYIIEQLNNKIANS